LPPLKTLILAYPAPSVSTGPREAACASCKVRPSCLTGGAPEEDLERAANIVYARRRIKRSQRLFSAGDACGALYAIRSGFFKTVLGENQGHEQVTGFFMAGELLGMEGFGGGSYRDSAIALEDSDVCVLPHVLIEEVGRDLPSLQRRLHSLLAGEIVRGHDIMLLLGSMSAEARLAAFLVNMSSRLQRRGYSGSSFVLRMTREEIGSYLGLKLETVSRLFSAFHKEGLLEVQNKRVCIIDLKGIEGVRARG